MKEKKIEIKGFQSPNGNSGYRPYTMNIALFGPEGAGKSRFIGTAPDPIGGLILDPKTELSLRRIQEENGKQIIWPPPDVTNKLIYDEDIRLVRKMDDEAFKKHYRTRVDRMTDLLMELAYHPDVRTIFCDPFYQLCQEIKWAVQGRHQAHRKIGEKVVQDNEPVYQEIIKLLTRINVKNTILTHKAKDEYVNNAKTNRQTWQGFKYLGNHTNVAIELERNTKRGDESWAYRLSVRNCQINPSLQGEEGQGLLVDEAISYELLARNIFSDVEDEDVIQANFL